MGEKHVTFMGEKSNSYKYFFRKLEGKRLLRRTRGKRKLFKCTKRGKQVVDWLNLARDRNQFWIVVRFIYCLSNYWIFRTNSGQWSWLNT
jgi:hypothetical protein